MADKSGTAATAADEIEYWRGVAAWMGDVIAATALRQTDLAGVSRAEKRRQAEIAETAAAALEGRRRPIARKVDQVVARLRQVPPAGDV